MYLLDTREGKKMKILTTIHVNEKRIELELITKTVESHSFLTEHAFLVNELFMGMCRILEHELVKRDINSTR